MGISKAFAVGKTKIYFKSGCLEYLESQRGKIWHKWAVKIQAPARGFITRLGIARAKKAEEERLMQEKYAKVAKAAVPIQCAIRCFLARKRLREKKKRKKLGKRQEKKWKKAAIKIQAAARGFLQRPKYKQALLKKKEEEDLA